LDKIRRSYIRNCITHFKPEKLSEEDIRFLAEDTKSDEKFVKEVLDELGIEY
jgi:hypothetical protein